MPSPELSLLPSPPNVFSLPAHLHHFPGVGKQPPGHWATQRARTRGPTARHQAESEPSCRPETQQLLDAPILPGGLQGPRGKAAGWRRQGRARRGQWAKKSEAAQCYSWLGAGPGVLRPQKASSGSAHSNSTSWRWGYQRGLSSL